MPYIIAGKSDISSLKNNAPGEPKNYELYLHTVNDFETGDLYQISRDYSIISVHQPALVEANNGLQEFNILGDPQISKKSFDDLMKIVRRCQTLKIGKVVLHGAKYNPLRMKETVAINRFAMLLNRINSDLITVEFDVNWFNTRSPNVTPLITRMDILKKIRNLVRFHITLDIEHFFITSLFENYQREMNRRPGEFGTELLFHDWLSKETDEKINFVYDNLDRFMGEFKNEINHIHLNGTDWFRYDVKDTLPLIGEHLPLGYNNGNIKDRFDYARLSKYIKKIASDKNISIVLEISKRDDEYEYFSEIVKSKRLLESYL